jgi:hypothetical protein
MSRKLQLLLIAGLLVPVGVAEAQSRPRMSIVRPRLERQFVLRNRMPAFQRFQIDRGLFRRHLLPYGNLRLHTGPVVRGRALTMLRNRPGVMRFRMGPRHLMRI